jgi:uncharacterized protein (DUF58 family)
VEVELVLDNRSRLPLFGAVLTDPTGIIDARGANRIAVDLPGKKRRVIQYTLLPRDRGAWQLGPAQLVIRDLFGRGEERIVAQERTQLIVYPRIFHLDYKPRGGSPLGELRSSRSMDEDPTRYRSLRDYSSGDELRRINWKASARLGKLISNEYEATFDAPLMIFLNLNLNSYDLKNRYIHTERAIEYAASLATCASLASQAVGLASNGCLPDSADSILIPPGPGSALAILDTLARIGTSEEEGFELFLRGCMAVSFRSQIWYVGSDPGGRSAELKTAVQARGATLRLFIPEASQEALASLNSAGFEALEIEDDQHG